MQNGKTRENRPNHLAMAFFIENDKANIYGKSYLMNNL